jgi:dTDP-glucose 4,6-dehydratase
VEDHCRGIEAVLQHGRVGEVYNIGGRAECENLRLVRTLCTIVDGELSANEELRGRFPNSPAARGVAGESLLRYVTDRPGHDRRYAIDCAKIEKECSFRPRIALEAGLKATVAWYLDRAELLRTGWRRASP